MTEEKRNERPEIIPPERRGTWIAVTFVLALLALIASFVGIYRIYTVTAILQTEIVLLDNRIDKLEKGN
ncbi:MAG: hypothetical protein D3910_03145 [Candidatus Electrothrix sp. ATG2]|nr:hypothetical protein [Candidatus Electrothrix sp. ATG2]